MRLRILVLSYYYIRGESDSIKPMDTNTTENPHSKETQGDKEPKKAGGVGGIKKWRKSMSEDTVLENTTKEETPKRKTNNNRGQKKSRVQFSTYDGHPLTANEARFIDEYIKTSNIRQSYLNSYPNAKPSTAAQLGQGVFNKPYIAEEIRYRLEQLKSESIADADEIMQYFTSVMRGEVKDQFGLEAPLGERTKAAQELAKRKIDIPQKLAGNEQPEVRIVLDWSRPNEKTESTL